MNIYFASIIIMIIYKEKEKICSIVLFGCNGVNAVGVPVRFRGYGAQRLA